VLSSLQQVALAYLRRDAHQTVPFWRLVSTPVEQLRERAAAVALAAGMGEVVDSDGMPGAGSTPGRTVPSAAVRVPGDHLAALRTHDPPVVARVRDGATWVDLLGVEPDDDHHLVSALASLPTGPPPR
jgi:L-seryl-tRNA(Ser) seleniumtransferase